MTGKTIKIGLALLIAAGVASSVVVRAANYEGIVKRKLQRKAEFFKKSEQNKNELNREWLRSRTIDGNGQFKSASFDTPMIHENFVPRDAYAVSQGGMDPAPSPGQDIGLTSYDYQANSSQAYNVARQSGVNKIHFAWMAFHGIPSDIEASNRFVVYSYSSNPNAYPAIPVTYNGFDITGASQRGGYCNIDVDNGNFAYIGMHKAENDYALDPYRPEDAEFPFGDESYQLRVLSGYDNSCPGSGGGNGGVLWPRLTCDRSNTFVHEIAHTNVNDCPNNKLWYWRYDPTNLWVGPALVSTTEEISYALAVDGSSNKVAVVTHKSDAGYTNVFYVEDANNGSTWLGAPLTVPTPVAITSYGPPNGQTAYQHLTATYNNSGALHVMWDEQEDAASRHIAIKHWRSDAPGNIRTVALGYWDCPVSSGVFNLNLAKISVGIGAGTTLCQGGAQNNNNYVYCTYTQFGGQSAAQLADYSDESSTEGRNGGYMNGEVYLAVSNSNGDTWSPSVNLTDTKTPGCNPGVATPGSPNPPNPANVCRSEHWATLNRVVDDIDIFFISDLDAGGIPQGEGSWQQNSVHYLQYAGGTTDAVNICPVISPVFEAILTADPDCEYHAPRAGSTTATLTILNLGNATLNQGAGSGIVVTDFPGAPTLSVPTPGAYSIAAGAADLVKTVTMASNNAAEGLYIGSISISHNNVTVLNPSPRVYPINFFVFDQFFCPEDQIIRTGVASPGSVNLHVESSGRFAAQTAQGTMWRFVDSSQSLSDASFLAAYGTQAAGDTTVFTNFMTRETNGQHGFRSQSDLFIDTSAYTTNSGYAKAGAYLTTKDSVLGVNMSWYFPQSTSADEVIFVKYDVFPGPHYPGSESISNVALGIIGDFDVIPAQRGAPLDTAQDGTNNHAQGDSPRNLVWQRGVNKGGYVGTGTNSAERFRGGIAVPGGFEGAYAGSFAEDLNIANGPTDQRLYDLLQNVSGIEIFDGSPASSDTDLYIIVGLDRGQTLTSTGQSYHSTTVLSHTAILASDTLDETHFKTAVDAATTLVNAGTFAGCAVCPCRYDPSCDGIISDVLDVVQVVGGAFRNVAANPGDAACNFDRRDVDGSGAIDVLDVVKVVGVAFRNIGVTASNSYVDPCTRWKEWN